MYIVEQKLHGEWETSGQIAQTAEIGAEIAYTLRQTTARTIHSQPTKRMRDWMRDHLPTDYRVVKQ